ncbi:MAG: hypothetical protein ACI3YI_13735, partial [Bacteroidaceae bacterium]
MKRKEKDNAEDSLNNRGRAEVSDENVIFALTKSKDMQENKAKFIELLRSTGREGVDSIIELMEGLGFFTAPASTKFHLSNE